ncbi:MAG: Sporulation related domain protein [Deltaproteobacteria bacterium ADurb.Bin510]|nr:MAG: Sporulation related domain protein [Deltaproteobacteria bacterium ADurb.Bin510]
MHLSSWRDREQALRELERLGGRVPQAFITKIDLGPRGVWYRVDCGLCVDPAVAEARRQRILRSGLVQNGSFVGAPMPFTVEIGQFDSLDAARARQAELKSQEIYTYLIGLGGGRYRVVCGAYPDAASAQALLDDLAALKLEARLVRR